MSNNKGRILVVEDSRINRLLLKRTLEEQGFEATLAVDGFQALAMLRAKTTVPCDVVLLDILMPNMDGYQTLSAIKADPALQHLPVIMISAVEEMDSTIRCIEMGATDYLSKPFNPALLKARVSASLTGKRLRDREMEYLEQVAIVTEAAVALEASAFEPSGLDDVARRSDSLGNLARVFKKVAADMLAREARIRRQMLEMRIEIDEARDPKKWPRSPELNTSSIFVAMPGNCASFWSRDLRGFNIRSGVSPSPAHQSCGATLSPLNAAGGARHICLDPLQFPRDGRFRRQNFPEPGCERPCRGMICPHRSNSPRLTPRHRVRASIRHRD